MTDAEHAKIIEQWCDAHGAKVVSDAAYAWMRHDKAPAAKLGIEIINLPHAMLITSTAHKLMSPTEQATDYAEAVIDAAILSSKGA